MDNPSDKPEENIIENKQKAVGMLMLEAGTEFAVLIAVPLLIFIYFGKKLDAHYHTRFLVVVGIFLALFISSMGIYKRINDLKKLLK